MNRLPMLPIDHATDCMDVFELATGAKGLSNDKTQRIVVMSIREDRLSGRVRTLMHWPTSIMLADGFTKTGVFRQLLFFATTGMITLKLGQDKFIRLRTRKNLGEDFSESDVVNIDG